MVLTILAAACREDPPEVVRCGAIPEGGCPQTRADSCTDPLCASVYACNPDRTWTFVRSCPGYDASVDAPRDVVQGGFDASIDAPPGAWGGPGCIDLQDPDCPLGRALGCTTGCCGCEDLFVCQNAQWTAWGHCGDGGIVKTP
jgi:hypothetical protein